ncbi:MAG: SDR family oxidoreductase, partial [Acidimicrobiia bacterium]|nr:SDR family oxidoreductase [Acidimicrobiia bacterium]
MILEDKTVVVVGVGPGLGREIAAIVVRDGGNAVLCARNADKLATLAGEIDPSGDRVAIAPMDITDASTCAAAMEAAIDRFGSIDAVVQVAALDTVLGTFEESTEDDWLRTFEVNVLGTLHVVRAATPHLRAAGGGSIVLISSQSQFLPSSMIHQAAYGTSKGALGTAMLYLARELGPDKIRVNSVVPTWMWGPAVEMYVDYVSASQDTTGDEVVARITEPMALDEIPADEDVAEAVAFLCSDRSRMITGQHL